MMAPLGIKSINVDDIIEYVFHNHVDLVLKVNFPELKLAANNCRRLRLDNYSESLIDEKLNDPGVPDSHEPYYTRHKVFFELHDQIAAQPVAYSFTNASIGNLKLQLKKSYLSGSSSLMKFEYTAEDVNRMASVLYNVMCSKELYFERILIICG